MLFCRRRPSWMALLLMLLGVKVVMRDRLNDEDKAVYRAKRRLFNQKLREAFDVWEDAESSPSETQ